MHQPSVESQEKTGKATHRFTKPAGQRTKDREAGKANLCFGGTCGLGVRFSCRISIWKRWEEVDLGKSDWLGSEKCGWLKNCGGLQLAICTSSYLYFLSKGRKKSPWRTGVGGRRKEELVGGWAKVSFLPDLTHVLPLFLSAPSCCPGRGC